MKTARSLRSGQAWRTGAAALWLLLLASCQVLDERYCADNGDCRKSGKAQVCASDIHRCVDAACNTNSDCKDPARSRCPEDATSDQSGPISCQPCMPGDRSSCAHITVDGTPQPVCLAAATGNRCVECTNSLTDCPAERPICDSSNRCRACADHDECGGKGPVKCQKGTTCASYVCISRFESTALAPNQPSDAGQCAAIGAGGDVAYVRETPCSQLNDGLTPDAAKCTLSDGLALNKRYVRLLGGTYAVAANTVDIGAGRAQAIVGAPGATSDVAKLNLDGPLKVTGAGARLYIDQVDLTQQRSDTAVVSCSGGELVLRGSRLRGTTTAAAGLKSAAVDLASCTALIQRNQIGVEKASDMGSHNDGVRFTGSGGTVRIDGNLIVGNLGIGINFSGTPSRIAARFNTVAANGATKANVATGVTCPSAPGDYVLRYSIVAGNLGTNALPSFGLCDFTSNFLSANNPKLTSTFRLDPAQSSDYRDKATPSDTEVGELVPLDIDKGARPQGAAWDYGASELPAN